MSDDTHNNLLVQRHDHVLMVTLNRPRRRNALDAALLDGLRTLWSDGETLDGIRCIVITGAGPGFCSGADMALLASDRSTAPLDVRDELAFLPGARVDCPVIVAVNGVCAGGGLHFVADADIAIASEAATFVDPHVSVGQVSALEPLTLSPRTGLAAAVRMALLGAAERLDAAEALRCGLVSEVVGHSQVQDRALELAQSIAANSPAAVADTRRQLRSLVDAQLGSALQLGWEAIRAHWDHPDAAEGPRAFSEKRSPDWAGQ